MNLEKLKKNIGHRVQLQPVACRLDENNRELESIDDDWVIHDVNNDTLRISNIRTNHEAILGKDHVHHFTTNPGRSEDERQYGFLTLNVQVYLQGTKFLVRPNSGPGQPMSLSGTLPEEQNLRAKGHIKAIKEPASAPSNFSSVSIMPYERSKHEEQSQLMSPAQPHKRNAWWKRLGRWVLDSVIKGAVAAVVIAWAVYLVGPHEKKLSDNVERERKPVTSIGSEDMKPFADRKISGNEPTRKYREQADQMSVYKETSRQIANTQIPPSPPNFVKEQEEWAKTLPGTKGEERKRLEADYLALKAQADLLEPKFKPLFETLISSFKQTVDMLNSHPDQEFGGLIKLEIFELTKPLVTASSEFNSNIETNIPVMRIAFPSGSYWNISLPQQAVIQYPGENGENVRVEIKIDGTNILACIPIIKGKYMFRPEKPLNGWPSDDLQGAIEDNIGGTEYLQKIIKALFERENKLEAPQQQ